MHHDIPKVSIGIGRKDQQAGGRRLAFQKQKIYGCVTYNTSFEIRLGTFFVSIGLALLACSKTTFSSEHGQVPAHANKTSPAPNQENVVTASPLTPPQTAIPASVLPPATAIPDVTIVHRIVCSKTDFVSPLNAGSANQTFDIRFKASECGGTLPDSSYLGFFSNMEICGADTNWKVIQPAAGVLPGVSTTFLGACPNPDSSPSDIKVVFIKKSAGTLATDASIGNPDLATILNNLTANTPSVVCQKNSYTPPAQYPSAASIPFTVADCGGKPLDNSFVGIYLNYEICGNSESWIVADQGNGNAPLVTFWYKGGCPAGLPAPANIRVLFIKKM